MIFDILQTIIMPEQNFLSRHMTGAGASDLPGVYLQEVLHRVADVLVDRGLDCECVLLFERGDKLLMLAVHCLYSFMREALASSRSSSRMCPARRGSTCARMAASAAARWAGLVPHRTVSTPLTASKEEVQS